MFGTALGTLGSVAFDTMAVLLTSGVVFPFFLFLFFIIIKILTGGGGTWSSPYFLQFSYFIRFLLGFLHVLLFTISLSSGFLRLGGGVLFETCLA